MAVTINIVLGNLKPQLWATNADSVSFVKGALEANGVSVKIGLDNRDPDVINLFLIDFMSSPIYLSNSKRLGSNMALYVLKPFHPRGFGTMGLKGMNHIHSPHSSWLQKMLNLFGVN